MSKDLEDITQNKMNQAFGRVGRGEKNQTYSIRFRSDKFIKHIFLKDENKIEVENMNLLFGK